MSLFLYIAINPSANKNCSLAHIDQTQKRWFGTFIKNKVYIVEVDKNPDQLIISGFFNMLSCYEIPGTNRWLNDQKEGLGYFKLTFKKEIATKFLKHFETIKPKIKQVVR